MIRNKSPLLATLALIAIIAIPVFILYQQTNDIILDDDIPLANFYEISSEDIPTIEMIQSLESDLSEILDTDDPTKINQATLAVLRSRRYGYYASGLSSLVWARFAGDPLEESQLDLENSPSLSTYIDQLNQYNDFHDPFTDHIIDFYHMMAVIDIMLTSSSDHIYEETYYDYMMSWGGDLDTFILDLERYQESDPTITEEDISAYAAKNLGEPTQTSFSESDFLGNLDGYGIALMLASNDDMFLSEAITYYYSMGDFMDRKAIFMAQFESEAQLSEIVGHYLDGSLDERFSLDEGYEKFAKSLYSFRKLTRALQHDRRDMAQSDLQSIAAQAFVEKLLPGPDFY